jgi:hypothetical protein
MTVDAAPGTVVVHTDVVCAWSTVSLQRFHAARSRLGLDDRVRVDHRLYLLEDVNRFALPMRMLQAENPVVGPLEPDLGITPWQGPPSDRPVTALLADEAVHAAKAQSAAAALEDGRARGPMTADHRAYADEVQGSPHVFLSDGSDVHDPGISLHWTDAGHPQVDTDDPGAHDDLVRRAADAAQGAA